MYFKKLEIFGFKSFAEKTVLNFEPGITAVVGPNGCGKSNIFDSIRWVLGEQSVKELRGSSMEDVIFNGTESKPSLGFAEVSLTFANENRALPVEHDEVTITRRLFRSGESEYLLNKTTARLRDIQELLMGTGIGAEAYSLIQQGKVDLVVSAKPEDRRMILDEAAGITKYKAKKKEALSKLKSTEDNLLRVNDITIEVKRQIASIERQANKARKYKEEYEKLKELEILLARQELKKFENQKNEIKGQSQQLKNALDRLNEEHEQNASQLTQKINQLGEMEKKINERNAEIIKLEGQIDLNNRQIGFNQERISNIAENEQKLSLQKQQLIERCRLQQQKIEDLKDEIVSIEEKIKVNEENLKEKKSELTSLERTIQEAKMKIRDHEEKILNLTSSQVQVRNSLTDVMKEMQGSLARKRRLEMENEKVNGEYREVESKLENVEFELNKLQQIISEIESDEEEKTKALGALQAVLKEKEDNISELEKKRYFFRSQKEFIEKLQTQYHDIPDPVVEGRLITDVAPLDHHTGIIGKVKEVRPYEAAKPSIFRLNLAAEQTKQLFEIVCETKFIELDPQQITAKIEEIGQEIVIRQSERNELSGQMTVVATSIEQIKQDRHAKEKSHSVLKSQKNDVLVETKKLNDELEMVKTELAEVRETLSQLKKKEDELNYELDTITQELGWCQNDIKEQQRWIAAKSIQKEEATVLVAQLAMEVEAGLDKLKSQQENIVSFGETLDGWLGEIKKIDDEVTGQGQKSQQYQAECQSLEKTIQEIKLAIDSVRANSVQLEAQREELGNVINAMRKSTKGIEEKIDGVNNELHELTLREQESGFKEQGIKDRLQQTYKINIDEVPIVEPTPGMETIEPAAEDLEKLKKRCESYGSVNMVAIEEFEELKQRFEFLTQQQADLLEAKAQLMSTISKINRSTRQMFLDTFTKVSEEFRIYYRMLFGGGEAKLVLLDPENVLESGIDIIARPPGKKLQNISLLSGGEKALTAIALIFGVFKVNPSPFCVLDEIDAALDESNVGRFSYLLQDFAKIAQFIVITHNKKTISSAGVMYGITMPETGVSRIVSVKFAENEKKKEAEPAVAGV